MSNGILERIEAMLVILVARETSAELVNSLVEDLVEETDTVDFPDGTLVSGEIDNGSTPWDARIHTSNKGKTQKGIWKRKPGLDDDFFNTVIEEIYIPTEDEKQSPPVKKTPPVKKAPPVKKTPPVKKAPPTKPGKSAENKFKGQALKNISTITEKFGATGDDVINNLLSKFDVDTFDALSQEKHSELYDDTVSWLKGLGFIQDEIDVATTLSAGSEYVDDINDSIGVYINEAGGKDSKLGSVPIEGLEALLTEVTEFADSWDEFFKE